MKRSSVNWRGFGQKIFLLSAGLLMVGNAQLRGQNPQQYFRQYCMACHTIGGGRLVGPDLKGVLDRQSREWLVNWIVDPEGVLKSGDPYALKLQQESNGAIMVRSPGMNRDLANALLDYIDEQSGKEQTQLTGPRVNERPFTPEDIAVGRAMFTGKRPLKNGGPACIGCHSVNSLGGLGGGRLGPNLTNAYERLGGRKGLTAWLMAPPGLTMQPIFQKQPLEEDEVLALVAFLNNEHETNRPISGIPVASFLFFSVLGALVWLVVFEFIWSNRLNAVRKPLFEQTYEARG